MEERQHDARFRLATICPSDEVLRRYVTRTLPDDALTLRTAGHLTRCETCQRRVRALRDEYRL